jgi:hypothetical protein
MAECPVVTRSCRSAASALGLSALVRPAHRRTPNDGRSIGPGTVGDTGGKQKALSPTRVRVHRPLVWGFSNMAACRSSPGPWH